MIQTCKICGETDQNKMAKNGAKGLRNLCKPCQSDRVKTDYQALKKSIFDAYGRVCVICGESHPEFLAVDHINNDGNIHRKQISGKRTKAGNSHAIYRDIRDQGFPTDKYQILCHNCNMSKQTHKYNPIQIEKQLLEQSEGYMGEGI